MLPKGLYVVIDCERIEPARYRVILNRTFRPVKGSNNYMAWSPCEGCLMDITICSHDGNILEVVTRWVESDRHCMSDPDKSCRIDRITYVRDYPVYPRILTYEAQVLTVGSVIAETYSSKNCLSDVMKGVYDSELERIYRKFRTPRTGFLKVRQMPSGNSTEDSAI